MSKAQAQDRVRFALRVAELVCQVAGLLQRRDGVPRPAHLAIGVAQPKRRGLKRGSVIQPLGMFGGLGEEVDRFGDWPSSESNVPESDQVRQTCPVGAESSVDGQVHRPGRHDRALPHQPLSYRAEDQRSIVEIARAYAVLELASVGLDVAQGPPSGARPGDVGVPVGDPAFNRRSPVRAVLGQLVVSEVGVHRVE